MLQYVYKLIETQASGEQNIKNLLQERLIYAFRKKMPDGITVYNVFHTVS